MRPIVADTLLLDHPEGRTMESWIEMLAGALGEEALSEEEKARLLAVAREVAHRVERRITPLATFLIGSAVGRGLAGGALRADVLSEALGTVDGLLPEAPSVA
jgi:Domain of unknown function (DUF6457)